MINVNNMTYQWAGKDRPDIAIDSWSMNKESCFIYGASGCGKSTFLNILSAIVVAQKGEVCVLGENLSKMSGRDRDRFRANNIGVIYQQFNLLPFLNGMDNILFSLSLSKLSRGEGEAKSKDKIYSLMNDLDLPDKILKENPVNLSVGQQQRLAIVRALASSPRLILADEPTSALDSVARDIFVNTLLNQCEKNNCRVVFFSHDMSIKNNFSCSEDFQLMNLAARGESYAD